jgi:ATP-binding cassette subfamily C protein
MPAVSRVAHAFLACAALLIVRDGYRSYQVGSGWWLTSLREIVLGTDKRPLVDVQSAGPWFETIGRDALDAVLDAPLAFLTAAAAALLYLIARHIVRGRARTGGGVGQAAARDGAQPQRDGARHELREALWSCRSAFIGTAAFSFIINMLMLTGAIFMLEVYDRVLPSRSVPTLVALCIIAGILFTALGLLDLLRSRLLARAGSAIDESLSARAFDVVVRLPVRTGSHAQGLQPLRDLDTVRSFLSSPGPTALFDLPWLPFYLAVVWAFHPLLGVTALIGAVLLVALTVLTEALSRKPTRETTAQAMNRNGLAEACLRNSEVLAGMGFASHLADLWHSRNDQVLAAQQRVNDIAGGLGAIARVLRMILQSAVLAVGAYLVIIQQASPGIIIAGAILAARALAPVDTAIANWRGFVAARQGWDRLSRLFVMLPPEPQRMPLPAPSSTLQVESLIVVPPGQQRYTVRDVGFVLSRGQGLGITGPSGSGKSSLARALVGAWRPSAGRVRLDGAALDQWAPEALGRHIGYLPQDVELFAGTAAQNIARFDPKADPEAVIRAAQQADVHNLIISLPGDKGYDTHIGDGGAALSAGQRQRVALARALYGDPFLVVLDEPDASLDQEGEQALQKAILGVRARGGIAIVISHRQTVLSAVDHMLMLEQGRVVAGGPKEPSAQRQARPAGGGMVHILKSLPDAGKH